MNVQWNYMVEFLSGQTKPLVSDDSDSTPVHCLYVEAMILPRDAIVTRNKLHMTKKTVDLSNKNVYCSPVGWKY
jgi:hypothetical protein